jgi:hypothetical protein
MALSNNNMRGGGQSPFAPKTAQKGTVPGHLLCPLLLRGLRKRGQSPRTARQGTITLVTIMAILGLVVIIGFVGNAGHVVTTKVNTQNAADAIAFSSAQWMARGMNAVTATNHMLGEVTGLVVVIEALGGPEADVGMVDYPVQPKTVDQINRSLINTAPINGLAVYGAPPLGRLDKQFIDALINRLVSPEGDRAKFKAFATIYDAKLTLKKDATAYLIAKSVANAGLFVPPPWGYISAAVAYGVHAYSNAQLIDVGFEYIILEGLEKLVTSSVITKFKVDVLEEQLIPALAKHGDFIAGRLSKESKKKPQGDAGIVNGAVAESLKHLGDVYHLEAAIFPGATSFRLPIVAEPAPSMRGTQKDELEWGTDEIISTDPGDVLGDIEDDIEKSKKKIRARIAELQKGIELMNKLEADINKELAKGNELTAGERVAYDQEKDQIARARDEKRKDIERLNKELQDLVKKQNEIRETMNQLAKVPPGSGNLSMNPAHLARDKMRQSEERYTQWVRATYPYVDSFRAPVLAQFETLLGKSNAAKYYRKWTDRYTLTKSWQFRSDYRFKKVSDKVGRWDRDLKIEPLTMYVMEGAFAAAGERRDQKGHEVWTQTTDAGKQQAEQMFTVIGITHRELKPLFSPVIYPVASKDGITTFAQAVFYNANEQTPMPIGSTLKTQAKLGWDTLNWDPNTATPEWGAEPHKSAAKYPWDLFKSDTSFVGTAKIRLNWQAKLMPVTKTRFEQAAKASLLKPKMTANMAKARLAFSELVTH